MVMNGFSGFEGASKQTSVFFYVSEKRLELSQTTVVIGTDVHVVCQN
jgi:hypothetical protein